MHLEQKIEAFKRVEDKVNKLTEQTEHLTDLTVKTKKEIYDSHLEMMDAHEKSQAKVRQHEQKLVDIVEDTKYWMNQYKENFKEQEKVLQKIRIEMEGDLNTLHYDMSKLVSTQDMKQNFNALSDLLFTKFT